MSILAPMVNADLRLAVRTLRLGRRIAEARWYRSFSLARGIFAQRLAAQLPPESLRREAILDCFARSVYFNDSRCRIARSSASSKEPRMTRSHLINA
jgi:hypothetical protein